MTSSRVPANLTRVSLFRFQSLNIGYSQVYTRCALRHYRPVNLELTLFTVCGTGTSFDQHGQPATGQPSTTNLFRMIVRQNQVPVSEVRRRAHHPLSVLSDYSVVLSVSK